MKATELMICDWVMYNHNVFVEDEYEPRMDIEPAQLESGEDIDLAIEGCFAPIPLTEDILNANGIKYQFGSPWWQKADPFGNPNQYEVHINNVTTVIVDYVHELQHALRLCGLEELADNFKLE